MNSDGFTLIELVMILVLVGILAVFIAPKLGDISGSNAASFADKLRADIRYAQNLAMTRNQRARVAFRLAPNGYDVTAGGVPAPDPAGGGDLSVTLDTGQYAGISITAVGFTGSYVEFNSLGVPYDGDAACGAPPCPLTVGRSVSLSGGGTIAVVNVQPQTGAVN